MPVLFRRVVEIKIVPKAAPNDDGQLVKLFPPVLVPSNASWGGKVSLIAATGKVPDTHFVVSYAIDGEFAMA